MSVNIIPRDGVGEDDETHARALLREMVDATDAGDAGTDDQYVEMLGSGLVSLRLHSLRRRSLLEAQR